MDRGEVTLHAACLSRELMSALTGCQLSGHACCRQESSEEFQFVDLAVGKLSLIQAHNP